MKAELQSPPSARLSTSGKGGRYQGTIVVQELFEDLVRTIYRMLYTLKLRAKTITPQTRP